MQTTTQSSSERYGRIALCEWRRGGTSLVDGTERYRTGPTPATLHSFAPPIVDRSLVSFDIRRPSWSLGSCRCLIPLQVHSSYTTSRIEFPIQHNPLVKLESIRGNV